MPINAPQNVQANAAPEDENAPKKSRFKEMLAMLSDGRIPDAKKEFDGILGDEVVEPLADAGYPGLGTGLATAASTATDYLVPDSPAEALASVVPMGKLLGKGEKVLKPLFKNINDLSPSRWDSVGKGIKILDEAVPANARSQQLEKLKKMFGS